MKERIKEILVRELGYSDYVAEMTTTDLLNLNSKFKEALDKWIENRIETEIDINGISSKNLMKNKGLTYPSALISLNWILTEPEIAIRELTNEIKGRDEF